MADSKKKLDARKLKFQLWVDALQLNKPVAKKRRKKKPAEVVEDGEPVEQTEVAE